MGNKITKYVSTPHTLINRTDTTVNYEFDNIYNNTVKEDEELKKMLTIYFYESGISRIIIKYKGDQNCEFCKQPYKKHWICLPCDHYIHKKCFKRIKRRCPRCNMKI